MIKKNIAIQKHMDIATGYVHTDKSIVLITDMCFSLFSVFL